MPGVVNIEIQSTVTPYRCEARSSLGAKKGVCIALDYYSMKEVGIGRYMKKHRNSTPVSLCHIGASQREPLVTPSQAATRHFATIKDRGSPALKTTSQPRA